MVALGWAATRRASGALPAATAAPARKVRRLTAWWGAFMAATLRASVGACQSRLRTGGILRRMARIGIDLARRIGTVDRRIFGQFIEHLGRCIYGGIYDEGSSLADARGFRKDVLDAVRPLRIPILRWPGGNFVSGYHWTDGVGPKDRRPRRTDLAWYAEESNRFGTDEFIEYCRAIGSEPYICVNMVSGTMDEAHAWVEYCNGTRNTMWGNLPRTQGYPEPHRAKYRGLRHDMWGPW